jgi:2-polyprenyl-6-methoxyphenol hydroxylase-like FAD-dependent oxidoreductase
MPSANNMASNNLQPLNIAVVGAYIAGLSAANVLHRLGAKVKVFEAFPHGFQDRGGAIGVDVALLQDIRGDGSTFASSGRCYYGDLWRYLYEGLPEGTVCFGSNVLGVEDVGTNAPKIVIETEMPAQTQEEPAQTCLAFDLIVGADGGKSTIRQWVTKDKPQYAGYTLWRGLVPSKGIRGMWQSGPFGYGTAASATYNGSYYETGGFPVTIKGVAHWNVGVYMGMPKEEVS